MLKDINTVFREVTIRTCSHLNLADAVKACKSYLQTIMPVNMMHIGVIDLKRSGARIEAYVTDEGIVPTDDSWVMPFPKAILDTVNQRMQGDVCFFADGQESPPYKMGAEIMGVTEPFSVLAATLFRTDDFLGFMGLLAWGNDQYTDEHATVLKYFSPVFAHRLHNTIRYKEMLHLKDQALEDNWALQEDLKKATGEHVVGAASGLKGVMDLVAQAASRKESILLLGETGVGKGVIANAIHEQSNRKKGPFIRIHCASVPGSLLARELFGHAKGAFTGAAQHKRGSIERAHGGTIFLDEVGDLPPEAQAALEKVLRKNEIQRVGGSETTCIDVRVIASTHRDLGAMVIAGEFMEALWQRINASSIVIPPLRDRKLDIPLLTNHFIQQKSIEMNLPVIPSLADGEMDHLLRYDWPGNVRELQNVVERALILGQGKLVRFLDLGGVQRGFETDTTVKNPIKIPTLDEIMIQHIRQTLEKTGGRIEGEGGAADLLGIHYNTLRARMKKLGILFGRSV